MQWTGIFNSSPVLCSHRHVRLNIAVCTLDSFEYVTRFQNVEYIFSELETLMSCMFCWCYINSFDCVKFLISRFTILGEKSGKNIQFVIFCGVTWMRSWVIFIPLYLPRENRNMLVIFGGLFLLCSQIRGVTGDPPAHIVV